MREIKFRGKRVDTKEWVYGYYFMGFTGIPYILVLHDHLLRMTEFYEVIPETVGQFTGLKDCNSKEIFEGDIVLIEGHGIGVIRYISDEALFAVDFLSHLLRLNDTTSGYIEVMGNVQDNNPNFEVGKTYRYNGKIGDPSPFLAIDIEEQDALFIVSGKPLVCTYVENHSCPFIKFEGMSSARGWILEVCSHLFEEVKKKTVVKEKQKEEKKEMPKFEVGKKYRYNGKIGDPSPFVAIGIAEQEALFIVSGEPLVCTYAGAETEFGTHVEFKGMRNEHGGWAFTSLYHLFDEVVEDKYVPAKKFEIRG